MITSTSALSKLNTIDRGGACGPLGAVLFGLSTGVVSLGGGVRGDGSVGGLGLMGTVGGSGFGALRTAPGVVASVWTSTRVVVGCEAGGGGTGGVSRAHAQTAAIRTTTRTGLGWAAITPGSLGGLDGGTRWAPELGWHGYRWASLPVLRLGGWGGCRLGR